MFIRVYESIAPPNVQLRILIDSFILLGKLSIYHDDEITRCRTSTFLYKGLCKTCDPYSTPPPTPWHNLNKLNRCLLDNAIRTYMVSRF